MHDDGSAGCSSAGPVAPYSRVTCRRPDDSLAPPLMEGRSAPLPPRRRWERHWWWPGRPSAAARGARAAVAACAAPASSGRPRFERAPPASSGRPGRVPRFERGDAAWDSLSEMSASKGETPNLISESLGHAKWASHELDGVDAVPQRSERPHAVIALWAQLAEGDVRLLPALEHPRAPHVDEDARTSRVRRKQRVEPAATQTVGRVRCGRHRHVRCREEGRRTSTRSPRPRACEGCGTPRALCSSGRASG